MKSGGFLDLLFRKQPIEKGEDELARSIRANIRDMNRKLSEVEKTMEELLAHRALPPKDRHR